MPADDRMHLGAVFHLDASAIRGGTVDCDGWPRMVGCDSHRTLDHGSTDRGLARPAAEGRGVGDRGSRTVLHTDKIAAETVVIRLREPGPSRAPRGLIAAADGDPQAPFIDAALRVSGRPEAWHNIMSRRRDERRLAR